MIYYNIALIALIMVIITDCTKAEEEMIEKPIARWLNAKEIHIKLLECSLCQTFWTSLIYLAYNNELTIFNVAYVLLIALSTDIIFSIIQMVKNIIIFIINKINGIFQ